MPDARARRKRQIRAHSRALKRVGKSAPYSRRIDVGNSLLNEESAFTPEKACSSVCGCGASSRICAPIAFEIARLSSQAGGI